MATIKRCKLCQKFFKPGHDLQKYCPRCRGKKKYYVPKVKHVINCEQCGIEIETNRTSQRFCNDTCRYAYHGKAKLIRKMCSNCGRPFPTTKTYQKYCDIICYREAKAKREHIRYIAKHAR